MKKYVIPVFVSAFLALGLGFRLAAGNSSVNAVEIFGLSVFVLVGLCGLVRFVPGSEVGMQLLLFFAQAQILGNLLLVGPLDHPNWNLYILLTLSAASWIIVYKIRPITKK